MVNKKIWYRILVLALVFGMALVGCDTGTNGNDSAGAGGGDRLLGTWVNDADPTMVIIIEDTRALNYDYDFTFHDANGTIKYSLIQREDNIVSSSQTSVKAVFEGEKLSVSESKGFAAGFDGLYSRASDSGTTGETKTVTFSLDKIDDRTFTVTVEGAKWMDDSVVDDNISRRLTYSGKRTNYAQVTGDWLVRDISEFDWYGERTSDTVLTYTFDRTNMANFSTDEVTVALPGVSRLSEYTDAAAAYYNYEVLYEAASEKRRITLYK